MTHDRNIYQEVFNSVFYSKEQDNCLYNIIKEDSAHPLNGPSVICPHTVSMELPNPFERLMVRTQKGNPRANLPA